jgi:iron(III) transport system substrate-binding protein
MPIKKKNLVIAVVLALFATVLAGCSSDSDQASDVTELTVYSGRSEEYIAPFFAEYEKQSGIKLNIRYGDSAELAAQILEEGSNSPADLFLSQDAGSLGAVSEAGLFIELGNDVAVDIPAQFVAANRTWVGVTGRARVLAYSPERVSTLPKSFADLTNPIYKNKVGIAPTNSSFQAFITALIENKGEDFTKKWLTDMKANGAKIYAKNSLIVEAIDKGEIDLGLVNHYYIWETSESLGRPVKAEVSYFTAGDFGNLINVSGAGVFAASKKQAAAAELINYLTSVAAQQKFVKDTHEYSLLPGATAPEGVPALDQVGAPTIDLKSLVNIKRTQDLLIEVGLL